MNWLRQRVANATGTQEPIYGPSAIRAVGEQAKSVAYTELSKDDLKWVGMHSTCVETQTFYFMPDSGHIALAQVIYSNMVGLRITCQFNCKIFYPGGKSPNLWTSDALKNHGFDDSRLCFFADGCAVDLSEDGTSYTIKSVVNEEAVMNIKVTRLAPGFQVGKDGKSLFGTDLENPWGLMRHTFWPRCSVEGSIVTKSGPVDLQGRAMFVHGLQGMKPHHAAAKWNFVDFQSPTYSAIMMEYTTPPSYGSTVVNVGGIAVDGEILSAGCINSASHVRVKTDEDNNWPEPEEIKFTWSGRTQNGKPVTAEVSGLLGKRLDRIDVMAEVPSFVKQIVGGIVGTKPYIYQYSPEPRLKIRVNVDGKETQEEGTMFSEATFLSG